MLDCSAKPLSRLLQAASAFWNWGELGSREPVAFLIWISPWPFGSGKLGTPFDRMQVAYLSAARLAVAFSADVREEVWQVVLAGLLSRLVRRRRSDLVLLVQLGRPFDPIVGSGKSLTP